MNIAYISADFGVPIFGFKGASIHVREMVMALTEAGHRINLISPATELGKNNGAAKAVKTLGVDPTLVELFPLHQKKGHQEALQGLRGLEKFIGVKTRVREEIRNMLYNETLCECALPFLQGREIDFVYERYALFGYGGIQLARRLNVPHILEVNAPLAYEQEKMRGMEMKDLAGTTESHILCKTDQVIAVSEALRDFARSCGAPDSRILVVPNSVDTNRFMPMNGSHQGLVRKKYGLDGKKVIGFVGSLKPWHGTETLLRAFRELQAKKSDHHLLIVGHGPCRDELESYVVAHGLNKAVTFTGSVGYDEIPGHIAAMDITVAPYIPNENFYFSPIKIFEYMAMEKPVVAAKIGQIEEVLGDETKGLLFEPGRIDQLVSKLMRLAQDPQLCRSMGLKARTWVEQERTWRNNADRIVRTAQSLLANGSFTRS